MMVTSSLITKKPPEKRFCDELSGDPKFEKGENHYKEINHRMDTREYTLRATLLKANFDKNNSFTKKIKLD